MLQKTYCSLSLAMLCLFLPVAPAQSQENPFADVPAEHWAYETADHLAQTEQLDDLLTKKLQKKKLLTRYEMGKLIAKIMAKEQPLNPTDTEGLTKLQTEFAPELQTLGLTVEPFAEPATNISFGGEIEYTVYRAMLEGTNDNASRSNQLLFRLEPKITINDHWQASTYIDFITNWSMDFSTATNLENYHDRCWVTGSYGNLSCDLGKFPLYTDQGLVFDGLISGARVTIGEQKFTGTLTMGHNTLGYDGRWSNVSGSDDDGNPLPATLSSDTIVAFQGLGLYYVPDSHLSTSLGYYRMDNQVALAENFAGGLYKDGTAEIWNIGLNYHPKGKVHLELGYAYNTQGQMSQTYKKAYNLGIFYGNADPHNKDSFTLYSAYRYLGPLSVIAPTYEGSIYGERGWEIGAQYTFTKNVLGTIRYFTGKQITEKTASPRLSIIAMHLEAFF